MCVVKCVDSLLFFDPQFDEDQISNLDQAQAVTRAFVSNQKIFWIPVSRTTAKMWYVFERHESSFDTLEIAAMYEDLQRLGVLLKLSGYMSTFLNKVCSYISTYFGPCVKASIKWT